MLVQGPEDQGWWNEDRVQTTCQQTCALCTKPVCRSTKSEGMGTDRSISLRQFIELVDRLPLAIDYRLRSC